MIPISYNIKNVLARRFTSTLTALGIALVVFVFADVLMLSHGLEKTLVDTGSDDNVIVIRKSSQTEIQSSLTREQANLIINNPEIAVSRGGEPMVAKETVILITLPKKSTGAMSNVTVRGTGENGMSLRPQVKIKSGRAWQKGLREIIVGSSIHKNFLGVELGATIRFSGQDWKVVGIFDAQNSGFDSEIWGDSEQIMSAFRRPVYSSVTMRLRAVSDFEALKERIEADQRLTAEIKRERVYYAEQSEVFSTFIKFLGLTITIIFSLGATIGAMITMYASVGARTGEIGTLRAIGFRRRSILMAFMIECLFLSLSGGIIGLAAASFMQLITVSTMNFQTFSEIAFKFELSPRIAFQSMLFAVIMGFIGGVLPAFKASRTNIVTALRS